MTGKGFAGIDRYRVVCEITDVANYCSRGHQKGERFELDPFNAGAACSYLFWQAYQFILLLYTGGNPPWSAGDGIISGACPDPYNLVTFRLIREARTEAAEAP